MPSGCWRNLETLDWSERVKTAQRAWIGRSEGVEFALPVADHADVTIASTRRGPTRSSASPSWSLAPEHPPRWTLATEARQAAGCGVSRWRAVASGRAG